MARRLNSGPTKAELVARSLAADISQGRYPPGCVLDETAIAAQYSVSRTPIREAIRRLTSDGIVETRAHRGAVVRNLSEHQIDDLFAVMAELEALCARWAALAMTTAEQRALQSILDASAAMVVRNDHQGYIEANDRLHEAIYAGAHNGVLAELTLQTRVRAAPFRRAQFEAPGRLALSHGEHSRVVAAILAREAGQAHDAMRAHMALVRSSFESIPVAAALPRSVG